MTRVPGRPVLNSTREGVTTLGARSVESPASRAGRLRLNPAARILWRTIDSVQVELGRRSIVLDGVDTAVVRELIGGGEGLHDSCDLGPVTETLVEGGFLWPAGATPTARRPPRLAGELSALRIRHGIRAEDVLDVRSRARVTIMGDTRIAPAIGAVLAGAGVGHVHVVGSGAVSLRSALPGGLAASDEGRDFAEAVSDLLRRAAPEVRTAAPTGEEAQDLVIVTGNGPVEEDVHRLLHADAQAHLGVRCGGDHLVVGPLVLPGLTSCLRCADLHRLDRDPAWTALAVQLAAASKYPPASDCALTGLTVGVAALHAITFLDGEEPTSVDGTIELELPDWRLRRRSWSRRADCRCATAQ